MKLESLSNSAIESADTDKAYEKAQRFLNEVSPRINPLDEEFVEHYGRKEVEKDVEYVAKMEEKFLQNNSEEASRMHKLAIIFEAIILDQVYSSEWLGESADTTASSRYDDIKNGIDAIVEWEDGGEESEFLALAIDVTFAGDVSEKFSKIKKGISSDSSRVKYFSHNGTIGLESVPRAVIGADANTIKDLIELWLTGNKRALGEHPVQIQILEEVIGQMKAFGEYAEKIGKKEVAVKYESMRDRLDRVYDKKIDIPKGNIDNDKVFKTIEKEIGIFNI